MEYCRQVLWRRVVASALSELLVVPTLAYATLTDPAAPKTRFGTSVDELGFPSLGRLVLGFALTVVLAVGAVVVMRRFWPALLQRKNAGSGIRSLDRASVSATLTVHLVEVEGVRIVIAEGRSGVSVALLPALQSSTSPGNTHIT